MFRYEDMQGRPYVEGRDDCYSLMREYYRKAWGLHLPNIARPMRFWEEPTLDLYSLYASFGFQAVTDEDYRVGDGLLMPIFTAFNSHAAVVVAPGKILHHLPGQLSVVDSLRPKWSGRATVHLRHPSVTPSPTPETQIQLHEVVDAHVFRNSDVQGQLANLVASGG